MGETARASQRILGERSTGAPSSDPGEPGGVRPVGDITLAKIVATIGPACESPEVVGRLIESGVNVFRFNFSHGAFEEHARRLRTVREASARVGLPVSCLGDLPGPKIRVGRVPDDGIELVPGQDIEFRVGVDVACVEESADPAGSVVVLGATYEGLVDDVEEGQRVLINDGAIRMLAVQKGPGRVRCRVVHGGLVTTGKGINLPESEVGAPAITERDWEAVEWSVANGLDFLALSFVRTPREVNQLKERLWGLCSVNAAHADPGGGSMIPVIAKIEKPQALREIDRIVEAADGVMVARGDLGVEMDIAQVPLAQKRIVSACRRFAKPCIVATQMLESMITSASPTRAEATDIANAVFDGAGAVMLSGETAVGDHPVLVVETMRRIVSAAEGRMRELGQGPGVPECIGEAHSMTAALAHAAEHAARSVGAVAIGCWSQNGGTALFLSQHGMGIPIVAYSSDERASRRMTLMPGVFPVCAQPPEEGRLADWGEMADREIRRRGFASEGDWVVLLAGKPLGEAKRTNTLTLHRIGDGSTGYAQH